MPARTRAPPMPPHRARHVYAGPYVDRASGLRKDPAWLEAALRDPATRFVPVWHSRSLVRQEPAPAAVLVGRESSLADATLLALSLRSEYPDALVVRME